MTTRLSVIVPLYNEEANIKSLFERLMMVAEELKPIDVEYVFVDDHSADRSFELAEKIAANNPKVKLLRLAENAGSHAAIVAGLAHSTGQCALFLAGDHQDPPELIAEMVNDWNSGCKIVWAARTQIAGQKLKDRLFSSGYWLLVHFLSGISLPKGGVDFFLCDRKVIDKVVSEFNSETPIFNLVAECGGPSKVIFYEKAPRAGGKSGWTLRKKLTLVSRTLIYSFKPAYNLLYGRKNMPPAYRVERAVNTQVAPVV